MVCWLCSDVLPRGGGTAVATTLNFSKISAGQLMMNLGLKSANEFREDDALCVSCAALIFKVDIATCELDGFVEQLHLRCGVDSKAFVRRITVDAAVRGVTFRDEGVQTEDPTSRPSRGLDVRVFLRRITYEDVAENTRGDSRNRSEILKQLSFRNPSTDDVVLVDEDVLPNLCADAESDVMDFADGSSVASEEPYEVGSWVAELPLDVALATSSRCDVDVHSDRRMQWPMDQSESVHCPMPSGFLAKPLDGSPPSDVVAGETSTHSVISSDRPTEEMGNDDLEVTRSPEDSMVDVQWQEVDGSDGEEDSEAGEDLIAKQINPPKKRNRKQRKFGEVGDLTKTSITRDDFDIRDNCFGCKQCDYTCRTATGMEGHINRVHRKVTPYSCAECGKKFIALVCYKTHLKQHSNKNLCTCCGKTFTTFSTMREHQEILRKQKATGKELEKCDVCGLTVKNLRLHKKNQHPKVKPECAECGGILPTRFHLQRHAALVHGVKKKNSYTFCCEKCDGIFTTAPSLHRHRLKVHGDTLDAQKGECFRCTLCPRIFFDQYRWGDHMNHHNGLNPFQCPLCEWATWSRVMLNQHTRKKHGCSRRKAHIRADELDERAESNSMPEAAVGEEDDCSDS